MWGVDRTITQADYEGGLVDDRVLKELREYLEESWHAGERASITDFGLWLAGLPKEE